MEGEGRRKEGWPFSRIHVRRFVFIRAHPIIRIITSMGMIGTQLIPACAMYAVMVSLKDGDCFFPDATPSVTVLLWLMGGYDSWVQPFARMSGHVLSLGIVVSLVFLASALEKLKCFFVALVNNDTEKRELLLGAGLDLP